MSDTMNDSPATRSVTDQDWRKLVTHGTVTACTLIFIALSNMPVALDDFDLIADRFTLGDLSLYWLLLVIGVVVGKEVVLEGMATHAKGARDVVSGAIAGVFAGAGLSLLVILINNFELRDPLVNWSPQTLEKLSVGGSILSGVLLWLVIGGVLGAIGGAMHILPSRIRQLVIVAAMSVLLVAILETVLSDISESFGLEPLADIVYAKRGGLTIVGLLIVAAVAAAYSWWGHAPVKDAKQRFQAMEGPERSRGNLIAFSIVAVLLLVLPMLVGGIVNELLANVGLFVLLALGLNIVVGLAGILDLGYVAFFAVGGYTTAILTSPNRGDSWPDWVPQTNWFVALLIVVVFAAITGLFIGAPVIRMRGDYLAIVTLGFGEIIRLLFLSDWLGGYTGGAQGVTNIRGVNIFGLATVRGTDPQAVFYLVAVFCVLAIYVSWRLEHSRVGRAWMAIREDESVAEAMGINTVNTKLMAFVVGAVLASFSGAIFAAKVGSVFPTSFIILVSIVILVVVIVGGMGNIAGVIAGAVVLIGVLGGPRQPGLLQEFSNFKLLIYGALLIWMMLKRPEGLIPNVRRTRELHQEEFLQDAWLKGEIDTGDEPDDMGEVAPA
ncbi:MAG: leucine/isoleucine/valine transporter permease subunit [Actinobacteria bacterium]|nr:leucine/isoleucine/valine transporter permease subunit [Actinomycetota bacterium]NCG37676.1 leucine/isoleucine/valine transporter permease subunit [Actinomycetota bacterium]